MRVRTLKLVYAGGAYRVITIKNSTEYDPGQTLSRSEVDALCKSTWEVVIVGSNSEMERQQ